jgi:hypothetical protein
LKLICFVAFTAFQLVNLVTSNYGFFVYLALALHVFLLTDRDVQRLAAALHRWLPWRARQVPAPRTPIPLPRALRLGGAVAVSALILAVSGLDAIAAFVPAPPAWQRFAAPLLELSTSWRLINTYHLFGHITRERIEPEIQVESHGRWQAFDLHHKPGPEGRAPDIVAPHQPRVDFQLWFYGLSFQHGMPMYVAALLDRLCDDPTAVQPLFTEALPSAPEAVRIAFWRYHFSPPEEPRTWWTRELLGTTRPMPCGGEPSA